MKRITVLSFLAALYVFALEISGCKSNTTTKIVSGSGILYKQITIKEKNKFGEIKVQYPVFPRCPDLNNAVKAAVVSPFRSFRSTMKQDWEEMDRIRRETGPEGITPPFSYDVGCNPVILTDRYISLLFTTYTMEGGAHGDTTVCSFTYDRKLNRQVSITETTGYTLDEIAAYCNDYFTKNLNFSDGSRESEDECTKWIAEGTAPEKKNYEKFTYDGKTLTVYFEPYIVAPYVYGIQKVEIPAK
ncbi:MAG: DUF3298 and DUF4163 domain-containing protein [Treponema sp.]|nr:DUF3298 and DUF4163 domain-containing protein [Treponema sp.]